MHWCTKNDKYQVCLHRPHQLSLNNLLYGYTSGPIDRSPGLPGSDDNQKNQQRIKQLPRFRMPGSVNRLEGLLRMLKLRNNQNMYARFTQTDKTNLLKPWILVELLDRKKQDLLETISKERERDSLQILALHFQIKYMWKICCYFVFLLRICSSS